VEGAAEPAVVQGTRSAFPTLDAIPPRAGRSAIKAGRSADKYFSPLIAELLHKPQPWSSAEIVVAGELLIACGRQLEPAQVFALWNRMAVECLPAKPSLTADTPDDFLLRSGEIPFLAGGLLAPLRDAKKLRELGRRTLGHELLSRTDRDGTPHAELLPRLPLWLAPLIRATLWAERLRTPLWSEEEHQRLSLVLERAIPLCRPNGRLAFSNGLAFPALPLFDAAAKALSLTGPAEALLRTLREGNASRVLKKRPASGVMMMPSVQSDWSRFAMLRSDWSSHADCLAISHHQSLPLLDVAALGQPVLHGSWGLDLQIGDVGIELAPEWACSCWLSDPDADYLELQMQGPGGLRVERQMLLSRQDHFLLLADCIRGARAVEKSASRNGDEPRIHLQSRLPLAAGVTGEQDRLTREMRLKAGKQLVRVFPLGLPTIACKGRRITASLKETNSFCSTSAWATASMRR
jgi:hypothetical protein